MQPWGIILDGAFAYCMALEPGNEGADMFGGSCAVTPI